MKKGFVILMGVLITTAVFAQSERKYVRKGNDKFEEKNYTDSEIAYRKAIEEKPNYFEGHFNIGDALYKQEKYKEAAKKFSELAGKEVSKDKLASLYHNLGNSLLNEDKLKESIEAYKQSLKYNPDDIETKHNLTYALRKLREQQNKQKKQNQNQDQNQNKDQQQNKNQQNKDQNKQNQQQKKQQDQQNQKQQQQQGQRPEISKEDAKRLLQALENDEKQLQKKLKKKKAKQAETTSTTKDW